MQTATHGDQCNRVGKKSALDDEQPEQRCFSKAHYTSADLAIHSLRSVGLDSPFTGAAREWIMSMTCQADGEEGNSFWQWIEENHSASSAASIYDTFFFTENQTQMIVATASIVADDRGMGARYEMDGVWLGGMNVRQQFRRRGIGTQVLRMLHDRIHNVARRLKQDIRVNLFTDNQFAMHMYENAGYQRLEALSVGPNKRATVFDKLFPYIVLTKDHVLAFLGDLNTRSLTYHNHKETSAWAGLAFYYLG